MIDRKLLHVGHTCIRQHEIPKIDFKSEFFIFGKKEHNLSW